MTKNSEININGWQISVTNLIFTTFVALIGYVGMQMTNGLEDLSLKVSNLESKVNIQATNQSYYISDLDRLKSMLNEPRFTRNDYDLAIAPILKQLNLNTKELNDRSHFMEETNTKILRLDLRLKALEK